MWNRLKRIVLRRRDLTSEFINAVTSNWFGPNPELTEDAQDRLKACIDSSTFVSLVSEMQLSLIGLSDSGAWWPKRALVFGYINGLSDGMAKSRGETSQWPGLLTSMLAINLVMKGIWNEQEVFDTCSRLTECEDPHYIEGAQAGFRDSFNMERKEIKTGLFELMR